MDGKFETLIIGASFYGMALLKTLGNKAILVERGYRIGEEFSSSLKVTGFSGEAKTELGKRFLSKMQKHNLIDCKGAIYSAPSAYVLAEELGGVNAVFATEIISIRKAEIGYEIELFNSEGRRTVYADRIIDTTGEGKGFSKKLNVIIRNADGLETKLDKFTNCIIYGFEAKPYEKLIDTRKRLYSFFEENNQHGVVFVADCYDYDAKAEVIEKDKNYYIIPSVGFQNPISAVDAGGGGLLK